MVISSAEVFTGILLGGPLGLGAWLLRALLPGLVGNLSAPAGVSNTSVGPGEVPVALGRGSSAAQELLERSRMSLAAELLALVFPPACAACGTLLENPGPFCALCTLATEPVPRPGCPRCAEPVEDEGPCPRCRIAPPPFASSHAAFVHTGPLARAIHRFKYEGHSALAVPLGQALAAGSSSWLARLGPALTLVPIPLHRGRLMRRGYDQAALLTRALARALRLPLGATVLRRTRATRRQVGLTEAERTENVRGAFAVSGPPPPGPVVLVDDVFTTGATARAAGAALRNAGVGRVYVLTLARAVGEAYPGRFGL